MRDLSRLFRGMPRHAALVGMVWLAASPTLSHAQSTQWTWTLYRDSGPMVLAREIPDTPRLDATLECDAGSGQVELKLYKAPNLSSGPGSVRALRQSANTIVTKRRDHTSATVSSDHPVFQAFMASGQLEITQPTGSATLTVEAPHLNKLRQFGEACSR